MKTANTNEIKNDYTLAPWQVDSVQRHDDGFFEIVLSQRFMAFLKYAGKLLNLTESEILQTIVACAVDQDSLQGWYSALAYKSIDPSSYFMTFGRIPYVKDLSAECLKYNIELFMTRILHLQLIQLIESAMNRNEDSFMGIPFSSIDYQNMGIWYKGPSYYEAVLSASFNKYASQIGCDGEAEHLFVSIPKPGYDVRILIRYPDSHPEPYQNKKFLVDRQILTVEKEDDKHSFIKFEDFNPAEFYTRFLPFIQMNKFVNEVIRKSVYQGMTKAQINDYDVSDMLLSYTSDTSYKRIRMKGADYKNAFNVVFPSEKSSIRPKDDDTVEIFQAFYGSITTKILP